MIYYLAENPWPLTGVLALVASVFLILLKTTQDGRYLMRALVTIGVAVTFLAVERLWVTDNERIEAVVHELVKGVEASDGDRVVALFAPEIMLGMHDNSSLVEVDPPSFRELLKTVEFDWLRVTRLTTHAGQQTKQGSAEFRVNTSGALIGPREIRFNFASVASDWSLGFRKMPDGSWKITRINPVNLPPYATPAVDSWIKRVAKSGEFPPFIRPSSGPGPASVPGMRRGSNASKILVP